MNEDIKRLVEVTKAQSVWLSHYKDGNQNGRNYSPSSVWTRATGRTHEGLIACQKVGFIVSEPDASLHARGWRHDITDAGRQALASLTTKEMDHG